MTAECEWPSSKTRLLVVWMVVTCRLGCSGHGSQAVVFLECLSALLCSNDADDSQICSGLRATLARCLRF